MIDALATEPHFIDHLAAVYHALGDDAGTFHTTAALVPRARSHRIDATPRLPDTAGGAIIVASYGDLKKARATGRPVILMEHGAGQSYVGTVSGSYLGAPDRAGVIGVLVPGEMQAAVHRAAHPDIPAAVVGSPKMDRWHTDPPRHRDPDRPPTIALSFHWDCTLLPETRTAWRHYVRALPRLAATFEHVIGHGHPRIIRHLAPQYVKNGFDVIQRFDDVLDRADVYVCDNSSTLYEFAATDRPVVVLNQPAYRRNIHHGLRFWSHADIGIQVDQPEDLVDAITLAATDPEHIADRRRELIADVYAYRDGTASRRAADAARILARQEVLT